MLNFSPTIAQTVRTRNGKENIRHDCCKTGSTKTEYKYPVANGTTKSSNAVINFTNTDEK